MYDQYGHEGVQAAEQGADVPHGHGSPFGGGGGVHFGHPGHGHMSQEEAQQFFSMFFGGDDPFGGMGGMHHGGMGGGPRMRGGPNPFSMFGGDPFGGSMGGMHGDPFGGSFGARPGGGSFRPRQPQRPRYDAIPNGTIVSLKGLVSKPERNGDRGEVIGYDPAAGRYTIVLEDTEEQLRVKASNLLQHVHVHLNNLQSQPSLNGKKGTIIAWNEHKHRYSIYVMDTGKAVSLKPTNVILEDGTVGQIHGLNSKPELNGKFGTIKKYIRDSDRYDVQLSASQIIRIKVENIIV